MLKRLFEFLRSLISAGQRLYWNKPPQPPKTTVNLFISAVRWKSPCERIKKPINRYF